MEKEAWSVVDESKIFAQNIPVIKWEHVLSTTAETGNFLPNYCSSSSFELYVNHALLYGKKLDFIEVLVSPGLTVRLIDIYGELRQQSAWEHDN